MGRVAGDEAKAAGPTRRALYSYPFERRTSYLLTFLTPSFHRLPRRCRIDDGHVPLASQPALSTVREFLIRSLAFFLPVSFFLPPSSPPRCTRNHAFNLDSTWKKERRVESSIVEISISINAKEQFSRFNPSFPLSRSSSDYHLFPTGFQEARHSSGNY